MEPFSEDSELDERVENLEATVIGLTQKLLMMEAVLGQILLGRQLSIAHVAMDSLHEKDEKEIKN